MTNGHKLLVLMRQMSLKQPDEPKTSKSVQFVILFVVCQEYKHEIMLLHVAFISVYAFVTGFSELVIINMTSRCNNICMH